MATEQKGSVKLTKVAPEGTGFITDERLYETADGRVVTEGDPDAHILLAGAGGTIDAATAARLRLTEKGQEPGQAPRPEHPIAEPPPARPDQELPEHPEPKDEDEDEDEEGKPRRPKRG